MLQHERFSTGIADGTGAVGQKIGRFEAANNGTLFLDEIGEVPLSLQPKLLRAIQDQEFERLGSPRTLKVNVRIIAATNRDLAHSVAQPEFRSDLYYRLNVFPIRVPAVRERKEDIPLLVHYFVNKFNQRIGRQIEMVPRETISALVQRSWPGNIRELENLIERSIILT